MFFIDCICGAWAVCVLIALSILSVVGVLTCVYYLATSIGLPPTPTTVCAAIGLVAFLRGIMVHSSIPYPM